MHTRCVHKVVVVGGDSCVRARAFVVVRRPWPAGARDGQLRAELWLRGCRSTLMVTKSPARKSGKPRRGKRFTGRGLVDKGEEAGGIQGAAELRLCTLLLNAQGTREMMAQGDEYGRMIAECKTDPMALERRVLWPRVRHAGNGCTLQGSGAAAQAAQEQTGTPPKSALEAKDYATKLVKAQKFAHAADMYNTAISLCQLSRGLVTVSQCRPTATRRPVAFEVAATPRSRQIVEDEGLIHTLYANLAFCRVKQQGGASCGGVR